MINDCLKSVFSKSHDELFTQKELTSLTSEQITRRIGLSAIKKNAASEKDSLPTATAKALTNANYVLHNKFSTGIQEKYEMNYDRLFDKTEKVLEREEQECADEIEEFRAKVAEQNKFKQRIESINDKIEKLNLLNEPELIRECFAKVDEQFSEVEKHLAYVAKRLSEPDDNIGHRRSDLIASRYAMQIARELLMSQEPILNFFKEEQREKRNSFLDELDKLNRKCIHQLFIGKISHPDPEQVFLKIKRNLQHVTNLLNQAGNRRNDLVQIQSMITENYNLLMSQELVSVLFGDKQKKNRGRLFKQLAGLNLQCVSQRKQLNGVENINNGIDPGSKAYVLRQQDVYETMEEGKFYRAKTLTKLPYKNSLLKRRNTTGDSFGNNDLVALRPIIWHTKKTASSAQSGQNNTTVDIDPKKGHFWSRLFNKSKQKT